MNILIEPVINGTLNGNALQARKFSFALKVTNLENTPSSQFTILSVSYKSAENKDITNDCERQQFVVYALNPGESQMITVGDYGYPTHGLISLELIATTENGSITFSQKNTFTEKISTLPVRNSWVDFIYIESLSDYQQKKTNSVMISLTVVLTFLTVMQIIKSFDDEFRYLLGLVNKQGTELVVNIASVVIAVILTYTISRILDLDSKRK